MATTYLTANIVKLRVGNENKYDSELIEEGIFHKDIEGYMFTIMLYTYVYFKYLNYLGFYYLCLNLI